MKRAIALVAFAIACGGDAAQQPAPSHPPPHEVMGLQFRVSSRGGNDTFCPALEAGLARSGLSIAGDSNADATLTCTMFFTDDDGLFRVQVNGQTRMRVQVRVEVRSAQNEVVDRFIAEYKGYRGGPPDEDAIAKVVNTLAYSPRIAAFARAAHGGPYAIPTATVATAPTVVATAAPTGESIADRRDDQEWFAIDTVKCKIPARVEACDGVRRYLQRRPDGAHAQEANQLLAAAQPALEKLQKDEVAWQKANRNECAARHTSDACVAVEAYEIQFPTGIHAEEAHRLLKAAGVDK
jgi:hypothetical protein